MVDINSLIESCATYASIQNSVFISLEGKHIY